MITPPERRRLTALAADAVEQLRTLVEVLRPHHPRPAQDEVLHVRNLGVEHLGRWIVLPGRPDADRGRIREPSTGAEGGRLVGFSPGRGPRANDDPGSRQLLLMQGPRLVEREVRVDDAAIVAPRDWN